MCVFCIMCIADVEAYGRQVISVTEGDFVTLNTEVYIQRNDHIKWEFGQNNLCIAEVYENTISLYAGADGRFSDRLDLHWNGSLTITNIRSSDSGDYTVSRIYGSRRTLQMMFRVIVTAPLPVPEIIRNSSQCSSSSSESRCSLVCSAVNVSHVTLSWFKGNSLLSSISVSDLSISLSLPLEVDYQDKNTYSCVLNNPIRNQTTHPDITDLCEACSDSVHCCSFTEAVIRLVLSVLVAVATVAVLVDHFRFMKVEQKMRKHTSPSVP
ncbi:CD48 antigen-like [Pseudorasbora parva]|uniref:CD48 antigen-like n=1 Tax=Pseudorasbora parva TaxID=51549 RepID=UPI00351DD028